MTAYTKAAKLKQRRGKPAVEREPNGRHSRRKASVDTRSADIKGVVIQRRIREGNIKPMKDKASGKIISAEELAEDPRRGYVLGLMLLDGTITRDQHDAGIKYAQDMARYYGLTGVAFPSARAQNLFAIRGHDGEDSENKADAASRARRKATKLRDSLLSVGNIDEGRRVYHTVNEITFLDNAEARCWPEHMVGFLRKGLNRLMFVYGGE